MGFRVLRREIVAIIRRHQRQRQLARKFNQRRVNFFLFREMIRLDLHIEAVSENRGVFLRDFTRKLLFAYEHRPREFTAQTARKRENAFVVFT